jgi:hypothetical protein
LFHADSTINNSMLSDPIIEELHNIRQEFAATF